MGRKKRIKEIQQCKVLEGVISEEEIICSHCGVILNSYQKYCSECENEIK